MKSFVTLLIVLQSVAFCQNRDSLRLRLYREGLISRDTYLKTLPKAEVVAEGKKLIRKLRNELPYKFPLDYLVNHSDTAAMEEWAEFPKSIKLDTIKNPRVLESFDLPDGRYELFKYYSFNGKDTCFLLGTYEADLLGFDLFTSHSGRWKCTDYFDLDRGGRCQFDTLNGGSILEFLYPTWATGDFKKRMDIVAIVHGRFQIAYETILDEESVSPWSSFPIRFVTTVRFADVNHDGYLDIIQETNVDSMATLTNNPFPAGAMKKDRAIKTLKKTSEVFIWDPSRAMFVKEVTRGL